MGDYRLAIASKKNKEILSFLKVLAKDHPVAEFESNLRYVAPVPTGVNAVLARLRGPLALR